jgi:hypothetical protein
MAAEWIYRIGEAMRSEQATVKGVYTASMLANILAVIFNEKFLEK